MHDVENLGIPKEEKVPLSVNERFSFFTNSISLVDYFMILLLIVLFFFFHLSIGG